MITTSGTKEYTTHIPWDWWTGTTGMATREDITSYYTSILITDPDVRKLSVALHARSCPFSLPYLPTHEFDLSNGIEAAITSVAHFWEDAGSRRREKVPREQLRAKLTTLVLDVLRRNLTEPDSKIAARLPELPSEMQLEIQFRCLAKALEQIISFVSEVTLAK